MNCSYCKSVDGLIIAEKIKTTERFAFHCPSETKHPNKQYYSYPVWHHAKEKDYRILPVSPPHIERNDQEIKCKRCRDNGFLPCMKYDGVNKTKNIETFFCPCDMGFQAKKRTEYDWQVYLDHHVDSGWKIISMTEYMTTLMNKSSV